MHGQIKFTRGEKKCKKITPKAHIGIEPSEATKLPPEVGWFLTIERPAEATATGNALPCSLGWEFWPLGGI